jgi:hypothetical protein
MVNDSPQSNKLHLATDCIYPLWPSVLKAEAPQEVSDPFIYWWLAQFEPLCEQLEQAFMAILHSPHSHLVTISNKPKTSGALKKHDNFRTDIKSGSYNRCYQLAQQVLSFDTVENRFIKMVLISTVEKLDSFLEIGKRYEAADEERKLPALFYQKLSQWMGPLEFIRDHSMFKEVGVFGGLEQESMVLQQRSGYDLVFRQWHLWSLYLDVLGAQSSIVIESVEELYQVWCFLQLKKMIMELGFIEIDSPDHGLTFKDFQLRTLDGFCGGFGFVDNNGVKVRLTHEPVFQLQTNPQEVDHLANPHILMEVQHHDGSLAYWLFNISYEANLEDEFAREYCVMQLNRQREALKQINRHHVPEVNDEHWVILLHPQCHEVQSTANFEDNPFYSTIIEQGVGAFPFMPKPIAEQHWLELWLTERLKQMMTEPKTPKFADA